MRGAFLSTLVLLCACGATPPPVVKAAPDKVPVAAPKRSAEPPATGRTLVEPTPQPEEPAPVPKLVHLDVDQSNPLVATASGQELVVRLRVRTDRFESKVRPPINLALVVDTSGSMAGTAIERARAASVELLSRLSKGDVLSVVAFGSQPEVLVPSTVLGDDVSAIRAEIEEMSAKGTTDMAGGLGAGLVQVRERFDPKGINRIVLVGDGVPNDPTQLLPLAQSAAQQGISITSFGLGLEYDETLMGQLATATGGKFHFVEDPAKLAAVFDDEVLRLEHVVAKAGWVTITPGPGVVIDGVLGLAANRNGRGFQVPIGDLGESQSRDVFVRVLLGEHTAGASVELLDAVLVYHDAVGDSGQRTERGFASAVASADKNEIHEGRDADIVHTSLRLRVADLTLRAIAAARGGDLHGARELCDDAIKLAKAGAKDFADQDLGAKEKELKKLRTTLAQLLPPRDPWAGHLGRMGGGVGRGVPPAPAPMKPEAARAVRSAHSAAMDAFH
jgi:Ca-activated chloride channel family protein